MTQIFCAASRKRLAAITAVPIERTSRVLIIARSCSVLTRYYVDLDALLDDVMSEAVAITQSLGQVGLFQLPLPEANATPAMLQSHFVGTLTSELYEMLLGERDTISVEDALLRTADAVNRHFDLFRNGKDRVRGSERKQLAIDQIAAKSSITSSAVLLAYRTSKHASQLDLRPSITIDRITAISGQALA